MPKFGVVIRAANPTKLGKAVRDELISEVLEDKRTGLSYFVSSLDKDVLKLKLGILYDSDIIEINSPVTEIFPFSYFAFCLLAFSQLITDIKNIKTLLKTRATDPDFG